MAHKDWTNLAYPDLRGPTFHLCASRVPDTSLLYICDPDRIFNATQLIRINNELEAVAVGTPCPCQRRSQCSSGATAAETGSSPLHGPFHGFVVSIALVDNLQMNFHSPSEQQLIDRAESFCKTLEDGKRLWKLSNCVCLEALQKMIIWPARLAERYITSDERKDILTRVNDLIQTDRWAEALSFVITELHQQLKGDPEERTDTGTLSLIIAVGVASSLTILVTCCVCAFRCCGNLSPVEEAKLPNRTKAGRNQVVLGEDANNQTQTQRSMSRSPKFPLRNSTPPPQLAALSFMAYSDTTVV
uniref:Uncharacterized protein n=1 Tax=Ditylenchus dipsaci TaxID=166011 RepID=A0A915CTY6_9BILA